MHDQSVSRYWEKIINKTKSYDIKPEVIRCYVHHTESCIKAHKSKLALHTAQDVEKYINDKGRNNRLMDWQYQKIMDSLQFIFTDMVKAEWATSFPWDECANKRLSLLLVDYA